MKTAAKQVALFIAVGCAAALVHLSVVVMLVEHARFHPLAANFVGWLAAVGVSFGGHHWLTFKSARPSDRSVPVAARRFMTISACGFAVNQAAYALALHWSAVRYDRLLMGVLVMVAVATFLASRSWAFRDSVRR